MKRAILALFLVGCGWTNTNLVRTPSQAQERSAAPNAPACQPRRVYVPTDADVIPGIARAASTTPEAVADMIGRCRAGTAPEGIDCRTVLQSVEELKDLEAQRRIHLANREFDECRERAIDAQVAHLDAQRAEVEAAQDEHRRRAAFGNAVANTFATPPAIAVAQPKGCSSDFDCGMGNRCVKQNYQTAGVCMKSVDEYGNQDVLRMPSLDSVHMKEPSKADCSYSVACPVGFRCDYGSGACVK